MIVFNLNVLINIEKVVESLILNGYLVEDVLNNFDVSFISEILKRELIEEKGKFLGEKFFFNSSVNLEDFFDILGGNYDN